MATRKVVYDDQDSNTIQYSGQWFAGDPAGQNLGNYGPPYLHTLHGTNHDASVSFEFDGTDIEVYGTSILSNPKTNPDPTLECFVDGVSIGREPPFEFPENNWKLCGKGGFPAGPHKLQIDIKVQSPNQTFWLDQIRYTPSPNVPLDNKTIMLTNTDPAIKYDDSWGPLDHFKWTSRSNAVVHVDFIGTLVSWVGYIPADLPHGSAFGTYSIDDRNPVDFNLDGLPEGFNVSVYFQTFFTAMVENGHHTLTVTFLGSEKTTPLTLDNLYIKNGTLLAASPGNSSSTNASAPTATATRTSTNDGGQSGLNTGALLGGILGGLGLFILIAAAFLYCRHRRLSKGNMVHPFKGEPGVSMPFNPYSDLRSTFGLDDMQNPNMTAAQGTYGGVPLTTNRVSAKQGEAFRVETRLIDSSRGGSDAARLPASQRTVSLRTEEQHSGRVHTDSGIRLDQPLVDDVPPHYTLD